MEDGVTHTDTVHRSPVQINIIRSYTLQRMTPVEYKIHVNICRKIRHCVEPKMREVVLNNICLLQTIVVFTSFLLLQY